MATARTRANRKYNEKAYDRIALTVPKGQREILASHAKEKGLSLNAFINQAIDEKVILDKNISTQGQFIEEGAYEGN